MEFPKLYARTAVLTCLILSVSACQTAHKPVSLLPANSAPALKPAPATAAAPPQAEPEPAQQQQPESAAPASAEIAAPAPSSPASDPIAELIEKVEKEYQAGLTDYRAAKNEEAKQHFDNALNTLLGSNLDIRSDSRLQAEFDRVVQGVNEAYPGGPAAEADAQQKSEPAPIDETNGITPAPDASTKAKVEAEIKHTHSDLPLMMTDQVAGYITYFSNRGRGVFERAFSRSGRYRDMMLSILKQEGVPQDLIYLAQAESGFHPHAVSRVGARGIWQFMGSRARGYGLSHNMYVDDRQDPEKSTRAAARHLKDLYNQFGDWYLAMAAYNSGPGTVQSAVKRTGYADFWELYRRDVLPRETRNYVPIIIAETIMAKNPEQYGLESVTPDPEISYDSVKINYQVDLRLVAECVGASTEDLQDLNPSLLRMVTPKGGFDLHIPVGTTQEFQTAIASIPPDMRVWWRLHQVQSGDSLMAIARKYHTTVHAITQVNQLDADAQPDPGAKLIIPVAPGRRMPGDVQTYAKRLTVYHVRKGDTVQRVSDHLGIPAVTIRRWNRLKGNSLAGRRVLYVHLPVSPGAPGAVEYASASRSKHSKNLHAVSDTATRHHTVKRGETLYSIANTYNTSVKAIKATNANVATLRPGMVLIIPPQQ